jgi:ATP-binding cassette subfamily F protein 3
MLLRPSNTLLLDEPTNHLDIDSKEVLLDALADYGGTLIFVSHDRYFVERLATKIIEVGGSHATMYPGSYESFLWSKEHSGQAGEASGTGEAGKAVAATKPARSGKEKRPFQPAQPAQQAQPARPAQPAQTYADRKQATAEQRQRERALKALKNRIAELEGRIADREKTIKEVEQKMSAPDFYNDHEKSKPVLAQHQALMWEVGELLSQWEMLQAETEQ